MAKSPAGFGLLRREQLLEQALGQGQACEVLGREPAVGLDAEALEHLGLWAPLASERSPPLGVAA